MDNLTKFGRDKAGYASKKVTQKNGDLFLDGKLFRSNLPFAILQREKSKLLKSGYTSKRVKLKYHQA